MTIGLEMNVWSDCFLVEMFRLYSTVKVSPPYLQWREHAAGHEYKKPEVHVEELRYSKSHEHWKNQQEKTHTEASDVFPQTPGTTKDTNK